VRRKQRVNRSRQYDPAGVVGIIYLSSFGWLISLGMVTDLTYNGLKELAVVPAALVVGIPLWAYSHIKRNYK